MSKLDELERKLNSAIGTQKVGIQSEINKFQKQVDKIESEARSLWQQLAGVIAVWGVISLLLWLIGDAWANTRPDPPPAFLNAFKMFIGALSVLGLAFFLYIVGPLLVIAVIVVICMNISKGLVISSLKSKIDSRQRTIESLGNDF
jgi:hypothetical protein